jgi:D-3-phosphoglycerate dehydrogenase
MTTIQKPVVILTDNVHADAVALLDGVADVRVLPTAKSDSELIEQWKEASGGVIRSATRFTDDILAQLPNLKFIGRAGVGVDNVDLSAATRHGVVVVNSPEGNTVAAAEHTVAMMLSLLRNVPEGHRSLSQGEWKRSKLLGTEAYNKTLGVVGLGKIGTRVAKTALALGMNILAYDPFLTEERAKNLGVGSVSLDELFTNSDVITLHTPKTKDTEGLINAANLAKCKRGTRLINCARGALINEADVADALKSGQLTSVALDVFDSEPPSPDSPILTLAREPEYATRIVLTPHLGASTAEAQRQVAVDVAQQMTTFFETGVAQSAVNIPALRKDVLEPVKAFLPLAETLGTVTGQYAQQLGQTIQKLTITCGGSLAGVNTQPVTLAVLKGLLAHHCEGVNYVNAEILANELGLAIETTHVSQLQQYQNRLTLLAILANGETLTLAGTVFDPDNAENASRIVQINDYTIAVAPSQYLLVVPHANQPGMVGHVATHLGQAGINISSLSVASSKGDTNLMAFNIDSPLTEACSKALLETAGVDDIYYFAQ